MLGMSACYLVLGGCFFIIEDKLVRQRRGEEVEEFQWGWVPPTAILILLFLGNGGYGTLIWVVVAELLPPKVRAIGNAFNICLCFILGFIASKTFVDLIQAIGRVKAFVRRLKYVDVLPGASGTFWMYGVICLLGGLFTLLVVPETKGKTIEEIQRIFQK